MSSANFTPRFQYDAQGELIDKRKSNVLVDLAKIPPRPGAQQGDILQGGDLNAAIQARREPLSMNLIQRAGGDILRTARAVPELARVAATEAATTVPQLAELAAGAGAATRAALQGEPILPAFQAGAEDIRGRIPGGEFAAEQLEEASTEAQQAGAPLFAILMASMASPGGAATKLGKVAKKAVRRAPRGMAAVNFRALPQGEAHAAARQGVHLIHDPKTKQLVGAPRGFTSIRQVNAQRKKFDKLVEEGAGGADWYERMRETVEEAAGWDPAAQDRLAAQLAIYSPQSTPETNLGFALTDQNARLRGEPPLLQSGNVGVRTPEQWRQVSDLSQKPATEILGPKTGVYYRQGNPTRPFTHTGTNDIFHARALGFTQVDPKTGKTVPWSAGLTPQQHAYMDGETLLAVDRANKAKLGGRSDWTAHQVQAAAWVAAKGKSLAAARPSLGRAGALEEAKKGYGDYLGKHTAFSPVEDVPGPTTGHLPHLAGESFEAKRAYAGEGWRDPQGRDILSSAYGLYNRPMREGMGAYTPTTPDVEGVFDREVGRSMLNEIRSGKPVEGMQQEIRDAFRSEVEALGHSVDEPDDVLLDALEQKARADYAEFVPPPETQFNPVTTARSLVSIDPKTKSIREGDMQILEDIGVARGAFGAQEGVTSHFVGRRSKVGEQQGLTIPTGKPLTEEQARQLSAAAGEQGMWMSDVGEQVNLGPFDPSDTGAALRTRMKAGLGERMGEITGVRPELARIDSSYVDLSEKWAKSGKDIDTAPITEELLAREPRLQRIDTPAVRDKIMRDYTRDLDFAKRGFQVNEKLQNLRHAFGTGGWDAVKKALKAGVPLPAVGVILREMSGEGEGA